MIYQLKTWIETFDARKAYVDKTGNTAESGN
jgi:hypothetical protein